MRPIPGTELEVFGQNYVSRRPQDLAREVMKCREERLFLTWRILNRTYDDYLKKPVGMPEAVWEPLKKRFTITDLASPVLATINSATYGGNVQRTIRRAWDKDRLIDFMEESKYGTFIPVMHRYATAYGTSYAAVGRKTRGSRRVASLAHLHPILTQIVVPDTDVEYVVAVTVDYGHVRLKYEADGTTETKPGHNGYYRVNTRLENSNYGFIPVSIGRFRWMDPSTPYGQDGIFPAVEETKQVTALMCDLMVLERNQSYSTMVIKGELMSSPEEMRTGPWVVLRGEPESDSFDAKWISPNAKIAEINEIIESKFERAATQCQVPIELFVRSKSGVNQSAGSALLQHKPLFDLVIEQQRSWREVELDLMSRISAFLEFESNGGKPVDLDKHREMLEVDIEFEHETHPSYNQAEVQTWMMMVDEGFKTHDQAVENFNKIAKLDEVKAEIKREMARRRDEVMALDESRLASRSESADDGGEVRDVQDMARRAG